MCVISPTLPHGHWSVTPIFKVFVFEVVGVVDVVGVTGADADAVLKDVMRCHNR